jgi:uncharacterized cupredoxin-like copper-binding protein
VVTFDPGLERRERLSWKEFVGWVGMWGEIMVSDARVQRVARFVLTGGLALVLLMAAASAASATGRAGVIARAKPVTVTVVGDDTPMPGMAEHEHPPGSMSMTVSSPSVRHGRVKFIVKNDGTELHEMVVLRTTTPFDQMHVNAQNKVSESGSVGEVAAIGKGKTKSKTMTLKTGAYVLVCNIHEHYAAGMRAAFTVT